MHELLVIAICLSCFAYLSITIKLQPLLLAVQGRNQVPFSSLILVDGQYWQNKLDSYSSIAINKPSTHLKTHWNVCYAIQSPGMEESIGVIDYLNWSMLVAASASTGNQI